MTKRYATGKHAFGFCDKTGFRYPLNELIYEVDNGIRTGMRVGIDVYDPDQPQNSLGKVQFSDPQALFDPRPDQGIEASRNFFSWNPVGDGGEPPVGNGAMGMTGEVGTVTISIELSG